MPRLFAAAAMFALAVPFHAGAQIDGSPEPARTIRIQQAEIEALKARIERIEALLAASAIMTEPAAESGCSTIEASGEEPPSRDSVIPIVSLPAIRPVEQPAVPTVAGIRFSGDFRLRLDASFRGASPRGPGVQNVRGRYRLRLNADREIARDLSFRMQLSSGAIQNGVTSDQDFAGAIARHPFFISEGYIDYRPSSRLTLRAGRMAEVFADNYRLAWDDAVRLNGLEQRFKAGKFEFRAGQYFLINPNTFAVPAGSPLTLAGVRPGSIARSSQLYHPGMVYESRLGKNWKHSLTADIHLYRNPNLVALTSVATGTGVTLSNALGISVSGPAPGPGNATVAPGSAILHARHYQVVRASYHLDATALNGNAKLPFSWTVQASRNVGTSQLRDAVVTSVILGRSSQKGDIRGQYLFAIKDANSLISQFTDDDMATTVGVNIATHHFRMDYNLRSNVVFQNLLYMQTERRPSNPLAGFYVPLERGAPRTWRFQSQVAFTF